MNITDLNGTVKLHNGIAMPYFGLGTSNAKEGYEVFNAVIFALQYGYRLIDTAYVYGNEKSIGNAVRISNIPRTEIFITSKVSNSFQGYDSTLRAFEMTMKNLKLDYLDLYLIHWAVKDKYKDTWRALETLYKQKCIRAIGVSNFLIHHLKDLIYSTEIIPMVNQIEFHPYLVQQPLLEFCIDNKIQLESWSPLMKGKIFNINELQSICLKYNKDVAQIVLRWNLQKNIVTIPKSINKSRIESNANIFDFELDCEEIITIDQLNCNYRIGANPDNFNFD
ncbi:MAG: aldo/keto reductase [Chlorobium sp.]|nr:MAG: aldo/keto reductase [Chlorobium sp.]